MTQGAATVPTKKRTIVYIDGFNFYYGMLVDRPDLKWLNYQRLAELLRPDDEIVQVRFFSAEVDRHLKTSGKRDRQRRLWAALKTQSTFTLILGKFAKRDRKCLVPTCHNPERRFSALEEKQTDVNLALNLIHDVQTLAPDISSARPGYAFGMARPRLVDLPVGHREQASPGWQTYRGWHQ